MPRVRLILLALALGLLAALPYLHGLGNEFIALDDPSTVPENANVLKGLTWEGAGWAMTTFHMGHWHPLTWLSHMTDVSLFGVDPWGHHLVNVLLHSLNAALLFVALFRLTGSPWPSAFVAALFGVHPLRVESVAWVTERRDVLAGLFFMLVLLAYERYARRGKAFRLLAVALLLAVGLTAKSMLVTTPFVLLLLDVWPLGRTTRTPPADGRAWTPVPRGKLLVEKAPLFALSLGASVLAFLAQREAGAAADLERCPLGLRAANAAVSYAAHLGRTVWPFDLAVLYPYPLHGHAWWRVLGSILLLVALSWMVISRFRRAPCLTVGWLWFLGMLVPVIGIVQAGPQAMADRHTYLPLVGVFIAIAWGLPRTLTGGPKRAVVLGASACAVVVLLSGASWVQIDWWKDSRTLFRHTLAVTSGNWLIENNLGTSLAREGRLDEATGHFREALRVRPDYPQVWYNLGILLDNVGRPEEAVAHFREALRLRPDYPEVHNNLAKVLAALGRLDEAMDHIHEALRIRPDYPQARRNLGILLENEGDLEGAVVEFREALRLRPDMAEAHQSLAALLDRLGRHEEAGRHFEEARRLRESGPPPGETP